jgi:hypothetical protein
VINGASLCRSHAEKRRALLELSESPVSVFLTYERHDGDKYWTDRLTRTAQW